MSSGQDHINQARKVRGAPQAFTTIMGRARDIVGLIKGQLDEHPSLAKIGVLITLMDADERVLSKIDMPMAQARLVLKWEADSETFFGMLIAERLSYGGSDEQIWNPVWKLRIPENGDPVVISDSQKPAIKFDMAYGENMEFSSQRAGISMAYAILHE